MRKLKLLLASVALLFGGGISVWAQTNWTDVTSVITNPSFETDDAVSDATGNSLNSATVTGWTVLPTTSVTNAQAAVVDKSSTLSVMSGSDGATAGSKYFYVRQNWNKTGNFGVQQEIAAGQPAGLYLLTCKIKTSSSDPNDTKWYLSIKEGDKDAVTTDKAGSATEWLNYGVVIYKESASTTLTISAYMVAVKDGKSKHYAMLLDDFQLKYISPSDLGTLTASNTLDLTGVIYNESIYNAKKEVMPRGWIAYASTRGNSNFTEGTGDTQLEGWSGSNMNIDYYQPLTNLPKGKYTVTAYVHDSNDVGAKVYGSSDEEKYGDMGAAYADVTTEPFKVLTGNINIGIKHNGAATWVTGDNFRVTYQGIKPLYDDALTAATAARDNVDYANITGTEKTELLAAIALTPSTYEEYVEAYNTLTTKTETFIAADANYNKFDTEKESALAMGVSAGSIVRPVSGSASDLENALHALYVLEDAAANSGYTVDATDIFGEWTTQNLGTTSGQHWSGDASVGYFDKWNDQGYTSSITNTVTLPKGKYVFKVAARAQSGGINGAFNMSVKIGTSDAIYKDFVAKSDTGKGIDISGAVNYGDGSFANENNGRGWEWRFIGFELDEPTEVVMKAYAQIYAKNWVGFTNPTLLTTSDNIGICQIIWSDAKTAAESARVDALYSNITGKERTDLVAAIDAAGTEPTTVVGYQSQTMELNDAKATFIGVKGTYDEYAQESVVATVLGVAVPAIDPASTTAATLITNMQTMIVSDYTAATTNYTYDATALLGAWSNAPGNNHGESWDGTTGDGSDEYYDEYNASARAMTQIITLPKAKYVLMAKGRASTNGRLTLTDGTNTITFPHKSSTGKGIETDGTPNFGDGTYANSNNGRGWEYRFLTFESDGTTATTLTFNWTTSSSNWAGLDDITLLAIPETETISEDATEAPVYTLANVTLTRTLSASYWNTFSVPFDAEIPTGWEVKEFASATDNVITFTDASSFEAGKPYLVKPTANVVNPTFDGVIVENTSGETEGTGDYKFAAQIYNKALANDGTIAYLATDGSIKKLTSGGIKGLRAYFIIPASGAPARLSFGDDETTGISRIENSEFRIENSVYNLQGQRVNKAQKGLYIKNGKKVVMK